MIRCFVCQFLFYFAVTVTSQFKRSQSCHNSLCLSSIVSADINHIKGDLLAQANERATDRMRLFLARARSLILLFQITYRCFVVCLGVY